MPKRTLQGVVVSDKQAKTVVVRVDRRFTHPIYKKTIKRSKKFHAHDEKEQFVPGDMVWIEETAPISKLKRWLVTGGQKRDEDAGPGLSNRAVSSDRPRHDAGSASPNKGGVNQDGVADKGITDFRQAYDLLVERLLARGPANINDVEGAELLSILKGMETSDIHNRIEKLLLKTEQPDKAAVSNALMELSIILPRLDLRRCMKDSELRRTLGTVPDRLLATLSENLDTASAAKKAAFALVAARYPEHYRSNTVAADERVALDDLQHLFSENNVTSFFTLNAQAATDPSVSDEASIDARLWNGVPFELNGVRPRLAHSELFDTRGDFDICQVKGAKKVAVVKTAQKGLGDGQFGGLTARLRPDPNSAVHNKVVVYFGNDKDIYRREVFDMKTLFPKKLVR